MIERLINSHFINEMSPTLYDALGNPIQLDLLDDEDPVGAPHVGSIRDPKRRSVASTLTPQSLATIMRAADRGEVEAYFILAEEIGERDPHIASLLQTRSLSVAGLPSTLTPGSTDAKAEEISKDVQTTILSSPAYESLVADLMSAVMPGISCVEIMWDRQATRWEPAQYLYRAPRHFVFDRDTLTTPRLRTDQHPTEGAPLEPWKWIVHTPYTRAGSPLHKGLIRPVAVCYAAKRYTVTDWLSFMDVFGQPIRIGKFPSHLKQHKSELLRALQQIGNDACGVIPDEMSIELLERSASSTGHKLFTDSADYWDKQASKAILGQTMTTDDGSSRAQSQTHQRVRFDIRDADARQIANTINAQLIRPFVELNYGRQETYPRLSLYSPEVADAEAYINVARAFVDMGGTVKVSELRERLGFSAPDEGDEVLDSSTVATDSPPPATLSTLSKATFATSRSNDDIDQLSAEYLGDWERQLGPIGELIDTIEGLSDTASYDEASAAIATLAETDLPLVDALAEATTIARGLGDVSDG